MSASVTTSAGPSGWNAKAWIATTAIASSLSAAALSTGGAILAWNYQQHRTERAADTQKFIAAAQQFDRAVTSFMTVYLEGKDSQKERNALHANIQDQVLALETAATLLNGQDADDARLYTEKLGEVGQQLDRELPAPKAKGFVQAVADARDSSVCVIFRLRLANGMDTSAEDEEHCRHRPRDG
ncbi:hypothetical protein [Sphingobium yanoikuyae]|uniref:hypothetical protein n=1 Tax=Sphingobium yanoikuyae TaxID=13690 RepID=UPI0013CE6F6B|nr:hypothetical protein [Sphingobium yanoikuyae]